MRNLPGMTMPIMDSSVYRGRLESLLQDENVTLALRAAYERHNLPVPDSLTKVLSSLAADIEVALDQMIADERAVLQTQIAAIDAATAERQQLADRLAVLNAQRATRGSAASPDIQEPARPTRPTEPANAPAGDVGDPQAGPAPGLPAAG